VPELPEVETVRAGLASSITNSVVESITVHDVRSLKRHLSGEKDFKDKLVSFEIQDVVRRGKFLWLPLKDSVSTNGYPQALVGHLGMSGQMLIRTPDSEPDKLNRVTIGLKSQTNQLLELRFIDQRIFGSLAIDELIETSDSKAGGFSAGVNKNKPWQNLIPRSAHHIARDLLDPDFDEDLVISKLRKRSSGIKRVILDQNLLSGIGNIYADESLWLSRLHYDKPADSLTKAKAKELLKVAGEVLAKAVAKGGTSFDQQYKNVNGEAGYFSQELFAYGQTDQPCFRCGTPIKRDSWANRGSHFCPKCQKRR
jgi:formamidopyrimidine-DNA glycosylase